MTAIFPFWLFFLFCCCYCNKIIYFTLEYYRKGCHVTDVGMIMMETGMLAHNYNFEGTYNILDYNTNEMCVCVLSLFV